MTESIASDGVGLSRSVRNWRFRQAWLARSTTPCEWNEILADCNQALLPLVLTSGFKKRKKSEYRWRTICTTLPISRKLNLKSNDKSFSFIKCTFRASLFLTCLVLIIVLTVVLIIGAIEFWKVKLNFIEYSITGRLNCHVVLSNLQNCEVAHRFSYYNELRMNTANKATLRCIE